MPLYRHSLNIAHISGFLFIATKTDLYVTRKGALKIRNPEISLFIEILFILLEDRYAR
jgi:hypothetical protein